MVVQEEEKLTAKVPRVLLFEVTEKVVEPPPATVFEVGEMFRLLVVDVEMLNVPEPTVLSVTEPVLPPLFLIVSDETLAVILQPPPPVPVIGGETVPDPPLPPQSAALL